MQWDASANAGFCPEGVEPWLPVGDDHESVNVADEADDPRSMLALHSRLIALRRREPALSVGSYAPVFAGGDLLAYEREHEGRRFLVALNLGPESRDLADRDLSGRISISTDLDREGEEIRGGLRLRPDEGVVVELRDGPGAGRP
jgi:alpha-glucosidase